MVLINSSITAWEIISVCRILLSRHCKGKKLVLVLLQDANVQIIEEGPSVSIKVIYVECGMFVVIFDSESVC